MISRSCSPSRMKIRIATAIGVKNRTIPTMATNARKSMSGHRLAGVVAPGQLPDGAQIDLAGAERRNRVDQADVLTLRQPQPRQIRQAQPLPELVRHERRLGVGR